MLSLSFDPIIDFIPLYRVFQCFHKVFASLADILDPSSVEALDQREDLMSIFHTLFGINVCNASTLGRV